MSSDNESDDADEGGEDVPATAVERHQFARIHVLRALAQAEQDDVVMHVDGGQDSSSDDNDDVDDETDDDEANYEPLRDTDEDD